MAEYKAYDLVLAKFPSCPDWPCRIIPYNLIKDNVLADKRNKGSQCCVAFYKDLSYYWSNPLNGLKHLTPELLEKKLEAAIAKNTDHDYIQALTDAKELNLKQFLEKLKVLKEGEIQYGDIFPTKDDLIIRKQGKKRASISKTKETKEVGRKKARRIKEEDKDEIEEPDGEEHKVKSEDANENENKNKNRKNASNNDYETTKKKAIHFRQILQRGLLQRHNDPSEKDLENCSITLDELKKYSKSFNEEILELSRLHKVLKGIIKLFTGKDSGKDEYELVKKSKAILSSWDREIRAIKERKDGKRQNGELQELKTFGGPCDEDKEHGALNGSEAHENVNNNNVESIKKTETGTGTGTGTEAEIKANGNDDE